jgi:HEXXH motif-containing protein
VLRDPESDRSAARYRRIVDSDPSVSFPIHPPRPEDAATCRSRVEAGLALLQDADPAGCGEIRALVREIVFAVGPDRAATEVFDGASALLLWGGILLNARSHETPLAAAQALVHEATHNLLFGLSVGDGLVENADERHDSPLRSEPRPLEGIYHATFVLARMHRATRLLAESGRLSARDQSEAELDLAETAKLFGEGLHTLDTHAELTSFGAEVLDGAREWMAAQG